MITASFSKKNGKFYKFRISGHSGYSEQGSDIVCAAVSAMAMLTVNTVSEDFGIPVSLNVDEDGPVIELTLMQENVSGCALIAGLMREISALADEYPKNVRVTVN